MEPAGVIVGGGGGGADVQRVNSLNLRDLLRIDVERTNSVLLLDFLKSKQDDCCINNNNSTTVSGGGGDDGSSSKTSNRQTLGSVLSLTTSSISKNRSLFEVIRDDPSGSASPGAMAILSPDVAVNSNSQRLSLSELLQRNASQATDRGSSRLNNSDGNGEPSGGIVEPARMSLMALLAETESAYIINDNEVEEEEEEEGEEGEEEVVKVVECNACCVCMVRKKGAAFIPCGHTFCRLCSRELYVQRGSCPLCNNLILEILEIF